MAESKVAEPCQYVEPGDKEDFPCNRASVGGWCARHGGQDAPARHARHAPAEVEEAAVAEQRALNESALRQWSAESAQWKEREAELVRITCEQADEIARLRAAAPPGAGGWVELTSDPASLPPDDDSLCLVHRTWRNKSVAWGETILGCETGAHVRLYADESARKNWLTLWMPWPSRAPAAQVDVALLRRCGDLLARLEYASLYAEHATDSWAQCPTCGGTDPSDKHRPRNIKTRHRRGCEMERLRRDIAAVLRRALGQEPPKGDAHA